MPSFPDLLMEFTHETGIATGQWSVLFYDTACIVSHISCEDADQLVRFFASQGIDAEKIPGRAHGFMQMVVAVRLRPTGDSAESS
jgi:hypothetical protein